MTSTMPTRTTSPATPSRGERRGIRALLAELGSGPDGEPIPPEVEARLDETLALLVAERGRAAGGPGEDEVHESTPDNVVPLRRRWLPRAGAAAAAVIVLGVGGLAVANFSDLSQSEQQRSSDSAGASAPEAESGADSRQNPRQATGSDSRTWSEPASGSQRCLVRERRVHPAPGTRLDARLRGRGCRGGRGCRRAVTEQPRERIARRARCAALPSLPGPRGDQTGPPPGRCCTTAGSPSCWSTPNAAAGCSSRRGTAMATGGWRARRSSPRCTRQRRW